MSLEIDLVKFIANIGCKQTTNFFYKSSAFWSYFFFPKSCLKVGGAAYTRVFTVCIIKAAVNMWDIKNATNL